MIHILYYEINTLMEKILKKELGAKLKERRLQLKMTQREVAHHLGIAQPVYERFEKGVYECSYDQLAAICRLFDLSSDYLLGLSDY